MSADRIAVGQIDRKAIDEQGEGYGVSRSDSRWPDRLLPRKLPQRLSRVSADRIAVGQIDAVAIAVAVAGAPVSADRIAVGQIDAAGRGFTLSR